jgi:hypothetical protein
MRKEADDMRPIRRAAVTGLFALWLAPLPALAGSQSSNSSSNCSDGRCRVVETLVIEEQGGQRGWLRVEAWDEERGWRRERPLRDQPRGPRPRRDRDEDGDDDDD